MKWQQLLTSAWLGVFFVAPVYAQPIIDLSSATVVSTPSEDNVGAGPRLVDLTLEPDIVESIPLTDEAYSSSIVQLNAFSRRLKLYSRELSVIQEAARSAGGDIQVSITPVGITPEDLVVPLVRMGYFDISPEEDVIVVSSKVEDPFVTQMKADVLELEHRRSFLINDVQVLESFASQVSQVDRPYQPISMGSSLALSSSSISSTGTASTASSIPFRRPSNRMDVSMPVPTATINRWNPDDFEQVNPVVPPRVEPKQEAQVNQPSFFVPTVILAPKTGT